MDERIEELLEEVENAENVRKSEVDELLELFGVMFNIGGN